MRHLLRGHLVALVALVSLLAALLIAAPAGARVFTLEGGSIATRGCNADAQVKFDVVVLSGNFRKAKDFQIKDFGYPNLTPPIPYGHSRGKCIPGEEGWRQICPQTAMGACAVPFGSGKRDDEFLGVNRYPTTGTPYIYEGYFGNVSATKVGRPHHRHFRLTAHGFFVQAVSEGGLQYGGSSTGDVRWKAHS